MNKERSTFSAFRSGVDTLVFSEVALSFDPQIFSGMCTGLNFVNTSGHVNDL
jgi:hypothetical protein